jgi:hypothetical protein
VNTKTLAPAAKGEKVNRKTMFEAMDKVLSDWEYGKKMILATLI